MTPERTREVLAATGAIRTGHFVGTNGSHMNLYVAKDRATCVPSAASEMCLGLAECFASLDIDTVVVPAVGGLPLSQWTAHHLTRLRPDRPEVLALYAEREQKVIKVCEKNGEAIRVFIGCAGDTQELALDPGESLVVLMASFALKRGFAADVKGKRTLLIEDVLTTGGSARITARAITQAGGVLVGAGVLANGGNVTAEDIGVPILEQLTTIDRHVYSRQQCVLDGLCARSVPINTDFGHGRAFLAEQAAS